MKLKFENQLIETDYITRITDIYTIYEQEGIQEEHKAFEVYFTDGGVIKVEVNFRDINDLKNKHDFITENWQTP